MLRGWSKRRFKKFRNEVIKIVIDSEKFRCEPALPRQLHSLARMLIGCIWLLLAQVRNAPKITFQQSETRYLEH